MKRSSSQTKNNSNIIRLQSSSSTISSSDVGPDDGRIESLMLDPFLTTSPSLSPPPLSFIQTNSTNISNGDSNSNNQNLNPGSAISNRHGHSDTNQEQQQSDQHIVYRLALTGGPCSGKTTGQARISTFFENLGWKVYRVPETASTLFSGGIRFPDLNQDEAEKFQENLIKVMISIERTFFSLAQTCKQNCLIICDRGVMDATAYMSEECWQRFLRSNNWNPVELRDNRYNQVIHLVSSADGAEDYYNIEGNPARTEGIELARELDRKTMEAWVGHPYMDVIDNSTDFDTKMRKMISALCRRIGIEAEDRLQDESRKVKFLVQGPLPSTQSFPPYQDFDVVHDYLITSNQKIQSRIRKRGQNGNWSYQQTVRRSDAGSQMVELRRQITHRDYVTLLAQRDDNHHTIYKTRRCFLWRQTYFQMDIYQAPRNGLMFLETYTTLSGDILKAKLPSFLNIVREVTHDPDYSMFELSKRTASSQQKPFFSHSRFLHRNSLNSIIDNAHSLLELSNNSKLLGPSEPKSRKRNSICTTLNSSPTIVVSANNEKSFQKNKITNESTSKSPGMEANDDNNNTIKSKNASSDSSTIVATNGTC